MAAESAARKNWKICCGACSRVHNMIAIFSKEKESMNIIAIIPARSGSSRYPASRWPRSTMCPWYW